MSTIYEGGFSSYMNYPNEDLVTKEKVDYINKYIEIKRTKEIINTIVVNIILLYTIFYCVFNSSNYFILWICITLLYNIVTFSGCYNIRRKKITYKGLKYLYYADIRENYEPYSNHSFFMGTYTQVHTLKEIRRLSKKDIEVGNFDLLDILDLHIDKFYDSISSAPVPKNNYDLVKD